MLATDRLERLKAAALQRQSGRAPGDPAPASDREPSGAATTRHGLEPHVPATSSVVAGADNQAQRPMTSRVVVGARSQGQRPATSDVGSGGRSQAQRPLRLGTVPSPSRADVVSPMKNAVTASQASVIRAEDSDGSFSPPRPQLLQPLPLGALIHRFACTVVSVVAPWLRACPGS